ncbi:OST-HTH/LOTUS domain-containing protein [Mesorhizobium sp. A556]
MRRKTSRQRRSSLPCARPIDAFDLRTFGSRKLSDLARKTNEFEVDHPESGQCVSR